MVMFVTVQGQGAIDGFLRKRRVEVETFLRKGSLVREAEGEDLDNLLKSVGLRQLPDLPDAKEGTHPCMV